MMARLQIGAGEGLASFDPANPCRINDPAVGSGGMLLAAAEVIADLGLEDRLHDGTILFFAQDVDPLCAAMTELNFRLHKLAGYVACANTLTDPNPWADPTKTRYSSPFLPPPVCRACATRHSATRYPRAPSPDPRRCPSPTWHSARPQPRYAPAAAPQAMLLWLRSGLRSGLCLGFAPGFALTFAPGFAPGFALTFAHPSRPPSH